MIIFTDNMKIVEIYSIKQDKIRAIVGITENFIKVMPVVLYKDIHMYIYNLVITTCFRNNLHQVQSVAYLGHGK